MRKIAPNIFVETRFPPYNLGLITSDGYAIAIDMPPRPSHAQRWCDKIQATIGPIRYLVLTDGSPERQIGAALCRRPLITTETILRQLNAYEDRVWRDLVHSVATQYADEASTIHALTPYRTALAFQGHLQLHTHTALLQFETTVGTAPGALWLTIPERHLLFAGDSVSVDALPPLTNITASKAWLKALDQLIQRNHIHHVVPGRGKAPILRGEIEQQREFLQVLRRTAYTLARHRQANISCATAAQDLGQTFFNQMGQKAVKRIKQGLIHFVAEIQEAQRLAEDMERDDLHPATPADESLD